MITKLECGCVVDDAEKSTVHEEDGRHYPIGTTPRSYCALCDLFRPCACDKPISVTTSLGDAAEPIASW